MPQTEKEKMLSGEWYHSSDPELVRERLRARKLLYRFNRLKPGLKGYDKKAGKLIYELFGKIKDWACVDPPFYCDYGYNIETGSSFYANVNCVLLDVNKIIIGDFVMLGPGVHIYTATHPVDPVERKTFKERGKPVVIGNNVWIGGSSVICPGVTIGDNTVIGAGSVVVKDIPANVLAAGNPCKVIKTL